MSTTDPRLIIVDNVDSSINYTGPWFLNQVGGNNVGNSGPPYQSTLHGASANASFSFAFSGSQIRVVGTSNIHNDTGVLDPSWQCFVDGITIGPDANTTSAAPANPVNNWVFCHNIDSLTDGPHVLTVNVTTVKNQTFWFDNIQYAPSASVSLDHSAIIVDHLDPQIRFGSGWSDMGTPGLTAKVTNVSGSTVSFDFMGVCLGWYGYIPQGYSNSPSSGTYSIDGKTPVNFILNGLPPNTTDTMYHQKFFETGALSQTPHTMEVVYLGNGSTPLTITNLIIQNGTASTSASPVAASAAEGSITPDTFTSPGRNPVPIGAIVGGVIGGLALVLFAVLGFFLLRRRRVECAAQETDSIMSTTPKPFEYTPLHQSSISANHSSGGIFYSQVPQSEGPVTVGKRQVYLRQGSDIGDTDGSQSAEPWNTSSGAVLPQQPALTRVKPSSSSSPAPISSRPLPLPRNREREAEGLQSNDTDSPNTPDVVLHADSGIRMARPTCTNVVDVPPEYTAD